MKPKKSKLNRCAVCPSQEDLEPQFDVAGRLYFLCRIHAFLDQVLMRKYHAFIRRVSQDG